MPTTKLRAPDNFGGLSIEGRPVEIGKDGSYNAEVRDLETLQSHGFVPWEGAQEPNGDPKTMTREELIEYAVGKVRAQFDGMDTETIRRQVMSAEGSDADDLKVPTDEEIAAAKVENVDEQKIATMNRRELFAYLKSRNVSSPPPVSNDELRERALETLRRDKVAA